MATTEFDLFVERLAAVGIGSIFGRPPGEASATIVHAALAELGAEMDVLLWNVVPTHPHLPGNPTSNRTPTREEADASMPFLTELARGRRVIPVGRLAHARLGGTYVRHPARGVRGGVQARSA